MRGADAWLLALGLLELGAVLAQWLWLRFRITLLDDEHRALLEDHRVLMQGQAEIRHAQTQPTGQERVIARVDLEVGDVVHELRDIRGLLARVVAAQRSLMSEATAEQCSGNHWSE
jgi:hypothetical protein